MPYERIQKIYVPVDVGASTELLDLSATAGTKLTWVPAEDMIIYGWGALFLEAQAASGFNTTAPEMTINLDAADAGSPVEKGSIAPTTTVAYAIGKELADLSIVPFKVDTSAGDTVEFEIETAGSGQTTTGECRPFVYAEIFPALTGAV